MLEGVTTIYIINSFIMRPTNIFFVFWAVKHSLKLGDMQSNVLTLAVHFATSIGYPAKWWVQECPEMGFNISNSLTD